MAAELKALNGCVIQANDDAVPQLLAAGFVRPNQTAPLEQPKKEQPKKPAPRRRATKKTAAKE